MVVFLDTSAIYALADDNDAHHAGASSSFESALQGGDLFLTHSYVVVESVALLARRLGWEPTRRFLEQAQLFRMRWVDEPLHDAGLGRFVERRGKYSLVDEVSFLVMREQGIRRALAFDRHFWEEGFLPYPA
jgi:predicted nucleic acid-binding protein